MTNNSSAIAGKVVAITGASSGIGRACAVQLAREGAAVALFARREDRLDALRDEIAASGGRAIAVPGDVRHKDELQQFVTATVGLFGRLDVMIANAGFGYHGPFEETPPEIARRMFEVNVLGTLYAAQAALAVFRRQNAGHVIAVSSVVGRRGVGGSSVYSATKSAQLGLIESLRAEFIGTPFHASIVFPVATDTEFHDAIHRDYGVRVSGHGPRQSAERVANAIIKCIAKPRAEVYPYRKARLLAVLGVIAPTLTDRVVQRFGRRQTK